MERNDIIKALGYCKSPKLTKCDGCPREKEDAYCMCRLNEDALSLIKELTEERDGFENLIHTMSEIENRMSDTIEELTDENERLRADKDYWKNRARESESEYDQAVKRGYNLGAIDYVGSFVERLKSKAKDNEWNGTICGEDIDQIAKEMIGEGND